MSKDSSFDIVSEVDLQEIDNAINQARKEIAQRFDLKGTKCRIDFDKNEKLIVLVADDDMKLRSLKDILALRLVKRSVSLKAIHYGGPVQAAEGTLREEGKIIQGIPQDDAKEIVRDVKDLGLKVQASIQSDKVRISGRQRDDLQAVITAIRSKDYPIPLQFTNYR
ncbi:MAG: YajQ family cyclic di-GMP-binding protein [Candidatus Omnitrophica bacterium]|nr:YajQ family cyclic di-GMP-binding protein [Candidatus Omnitrophota bacterium]